MKKWIWVLALPYVVTVSTKPACPEHVNKESSPIYVYSTDCGSVSHEILFGKDAGGYRCAGSTENCQWIYDMAEALNAAHERRVGKPYEDPIYRLKAN